MRELERERDVDRRLLERDREHEREQDLRDFKREQERLDVGREHEHLDMERERDREHIMAAEHSRHSALEVALNPVFIPRRPTKILFSPGTGAGWATYVPRGSSDAFMVWMLTYDPLIRGLEKGAHRGKYIGVPFSSWGFPYGG